MVVDHGVQGHDHEPEEHRNDCNGEHSRGSVSEDCAVAASSEVRDCSDAVDALPSDAVDALPRDQVDVRARPTGNFYEHEDREGAMQMYEDVSGDGGVLKRLLKPGDAAVGQAPLGQVVKVHYDGWFVGGRHHGKKFDTSRGKVMDDKSGREEFYRFLLGENFEAVRDGWTIRGFTYAVETMNRGEIAEFIFEPAYGYGEKGNTSRPKVHRNAKLRYEIQFFAWRTPLSSRVDVSKLEMGARIDRAAAFKEEAISYFRDGQLEEAHERFHHAAECVHEFGFAAPEGRRAEAIGICISCLLNEAHCFIQLGLHRQALLPCQRALEDDPDNVKALYRRATAQMHLHEYTAARADLRRAALLDPTSRDVRAQIEAVKRAEAAHKAAEVEMAVKSLSKALVAGAGRGQGWSGPLPRVYFEVSLDGDLVGRLTMELYADRLPKTAANFCALCTGEKGYHPLSRKRLSYAGSRFHRVVAGMAVQGGDILVGDGTGNESADGGKFADEGFDHKHDDPGLLAMASSGRDRNGSQFYITTAACPHLDGHHVGTASAFCPTASAADTSRNPARGDIPQSRLPRTRFFVSTCLAGCLRPRAYWDGGRVPNGGGAAALPPDPSPI